MSKEKLEIRLLSIDWDYFIDATREVRYNCFPDGNDLSTYHNKHILDMVWFTIYGNTRGQDIQEIGVPEDYYFMMDYIIRENFQTYHISHSHIDIYNYVEDSLSDVLAQNPVHLIIHNIDFHHDLYLDKGNLTCGNWAHKLTEIKGVESVEIVWHKREDSSSYGFHEPSEKITFREEVGIEKLPASYFDLVFLCRSDDWSPPHLDKYFIELTKAIMYNVKVTGKKQIEMIDSLNRYDEKMKKNIVLMKELYNSNFKDIKKIEDIV